ncbi:MAG: hypothetical protein MUE95_14320 [Cyclobacteriaceae bacterium]|jgi:hypothetical protein|nr:hypothetical protein [Cyclobacteriaceae bacterium]
MIRAWKKGLVVLAITTLVTVSGCSPDLTDDPIPPVFFENIVLNLSLPENSDLMTQGFKYIGGRAGVRGIIVYRRTPTQFLAFERNCSYLPNSACATVDVHSSTLFMQDVCCSSTFNWEGNPTGGPAWRPLRQYATFLTGNILTITDEVINF